ncbi:MAG TPA: iron-containing alcohol dehydrogenase [Candidatus Limnocylindrales bacterium]|nr:iron-containing alcohol dehydrogenase [Candidatus Limnocylindrales bacterium]
MIQLDQAMLERAMHPDLRIGRGLLGPALAAIDGRIALLSQPEPYAGLDPSIRGRAAITIMVESLDADYLEALAGEVLGVDRIVGIGGGMVVDAAKYLAWRSGLPLLLAPSIVSVDAVVTNTIAVRRGGSVVYEGFVVADAIVADLELIAGAPVRLNRAGIGDLLSIHTGLFDWRLGAAAGRIAFDDEIAQRAGAVLERLYGLAADIHAVTDEALETILRGYVEVNELCLRAGHSGPEEGSEHYLAYHLEAGAGRSFIHGELIGLGAVLMARLQENDPEVVVTFLDTCGVAWRPADQGIDQEVLRAALGELPAFVREAGLPYSIIDEADLGPHAVGRLLDDTPLGGS